VRGGRRLLDGSDATVLPLEAGGSEEGAKSSSNPLQWLENIRAAAIRNKYESNHIKDVLRSTVSIAVSTRHGCTPYLVGA
jgi:hypothetical protein